MKYARIRWPATVRDAVKLQERDRRRLVIEPLRPDPEYVAGVDAAFSPTTAFAAACLYRYPEMILVEQAVHGEKRTFPYIPGYLLFLEGPALAAALLKLKHCPDVVLVDGHGIAHPRNIGSASHLGVLLGVPTIGCAKTRLTGSFKEPGSRRGEWSQLQVGGKIAGAVLRTRDSVRPLFISPGHRTDLRSAIRIVLTCVQGYRIPEPMRCADILSRRTRDSLCSR